MQNSGNQKLNIDRLQKRYQTPQQDGQGQGGAAAGGFR